MMKLRNLKLLLILLPVVAVFAGAEETVVLSIDECIGLGMKNNLDIRKSNYDVLNAGESVEQFRSQYEPSLNLSAGKTEIKTSGANIMYGTQNITETLSLGIRKRFLNTGGALNLDFKNEMMDTNSALQAFNPSAFNPTYDSNVTLSYSQPLLKNFLGRNDRKNVKSMNITKNIAELSFTIQKNMLINRINKACLDLNYANKNLQSQEMLLKRSKELFALNKRKLRDGLVEEVDIIATEAAITLRESSLLLVGDTVKNAEDSLKTVIGITDDKTYRFNIDYPEEFNHTDLKEADVVKKALSNRVELKIAGNTLLMDGIKSDIEKNEKLPSLDLVARYGLGNTGREYRENYDAFNAGDYPTWYLGVNMSLNPFQKNNSSRLRQSRNTYNKDKLDIEKQKQSITDECAAVTRRINTQAAYVSAAKKALKLQKKKLALEEVKFNRGRSSVQWILAFQDDLTRAETEYNKALTDYYKAKADLILVLGENK
jgi:outer membrane protein TolC